MAIIKFGTSVAELIPGVPISAQISTEVTASRLAPYVQEGIKTYDWGSSYDYQFAPQSELWHSFYGYCTETSMSSGWDIYALRSGDTALVRAVINSSELFDFQYYDGSSWITFASTPIMTAVLARYDIRCKIAASGGAIEVWFNGAKLGEVTGNTLFTAETTCDTVYFCARFTNDSWIQSAQIIADEPTLDMVYQQLLPNGAGTHSDWVGAYTDVDETGLNDADQITSTAVNEVSTFAVNDLDPALTTGYDVLALGVSARASKGAQSTGYLKAVCYEGATFGESASGQLGLGKLPFQHVFGVNPDTSLPWTVAEINAAQLGIKSVAS